MTLELTTVDAYSQTTGACGGIDFWGNCWEWTLSTDASGSYIVKGGSWDSERDDYRSEKSDVVRTGTQGYVNVGFRVVRVEPLKNCKRTDKLIINWNAKKVQFTIKCTALFYVIQE